MAIKRRLKITSKGQMTKKVRDRLKTDTVSFEMRDATGSLGEYAKNVKPETSMKRTKSKAWEEAVREKTGKRCWFER